MSADETEILIKRITFWLQEDPSAKRFNTERFDGILKQWLEFKRLSPKQIAILKGIVARHVPKDLTVKSNLDLSKQNPLKE